MKTRAILTERIASIRERIENACRRVGRDPAAVTLVAVTKTTSPEIAQILKDLRVPDLGESRPQELWDKAAAVPNAKWHLIGHLQRNKIERTVPLVKLIHSVDSERLLDALHEFGVARGSPVPILLEVNCSREATKEGFAPEAVPAISDRLSSLSGISVRGLMTMAAPSENPRSARPVFAELRRLRDELCSRTSLELPHLSMGMSGDFEVAVEEGATFVRIGTLLFEGLS